MELCKKKAFHGHISQLVNWQVKFVVGKTTKASGNKNAKCNSHICILNTATFHVLWMNFHG